MLLTDLLHPERVWLRQTARSKKNLLELASRALVTDQAEVSERIIFSALCQRERIGSTGLGHGVAIPHGRIKNIDEPKLALLTLRDPIDFGSPDDQPVDLIFAIAVPDSHHAEHVGLLAEIVELLQLAERRTELRNAQGPNRLLADIRTWLVEQTSA